MDILFANTHPEREKTEYLDRTTNLPIHNPPKRSWLNVLAEQAINSVIVGGIAGISALGAGAESSWKAGLIAFGITALSELRKYRKL